jgi:uncharacterized protein (TIGR02145 family)
LKIARFISELTLTIALMVSIFGCDKTKEPTDIQPVAYFKLSPESGNTTTVFRFITDSVTDQGTRENPVFVRWDWESDGIWDWMYSTGSVITHRFFKAGTYRIKLEASTLTNRRDSMYVTINVPQGYSPPRSAFSMMPDSANIKSEFIFNASISKDDEDSLDQLEFRWDFNGDLKWDTDFSKNPVISHRYDNDFRYFVSLETRDPQKMTSVKTDTLIVTRLNDRIVPVVTHDCWPCTLEDTVRLDASGSYLIGKPGAKLLYSWDLFNDNIWEVLNNENPYYQKVIKREGKFAIRARVTDDEGLYMDFIDSVELFAFNSPPVTRLIVGNRIGNTGSTYYLHIRASTDRDDSYMDLKSRWDTNNDGFWEAEYDGLYEINIKFNAPGRYPVTAMMTDPKNKSTTDTDTVWVVAGTHETGLLSDRRGTFLPIYYGTVKIGNRWWMQSNLRYNPTGKSDWTADYYNNNSALAERYGALYPHGATNSKNPQACPKDWHVPTRAEWQQLMTDLGQDATVERLMEGGRSEFHAVLAGQEDSHANFPGVVSKFSGLGKFTNIWTSTDNLTGQAWIWYIDPIRKENREALVGRNYWFPIRCIKDE